MTEKNAEQKGAGPTHKPGVPKDQHGDDQRTMGNHPVDLNSVGAKANFPPGVSPKDAHDPGRQTPDAPKVENRS